ncbi:MAG TPA: hypothetical protein VGC09_15065 [Rhodopila sp.]
MIFYAAEITAYRPGASALTIAYGWGTAPWGTLAQLPDVVASTGIILASDVGYRTSPADADGPVPYPPLVAEAFSIVRAVNLDPTNSAIAASWGSIQLSNVDNAFDAIAASWNNDGRPARVLCGTKTLDATRGIFLDPAYTTLTPVFAGVSTPWSLTDTQLQIPLRDATYWLENPVQTTQYLGTGTYEGTANMAGVLKPKTRGAAFNVTPVLIDPAHLIYQYSDAPGTVVDLYEGGAANHTFQGDTTNLYAGGTSAGNYRTDNSRGLFQLGSSPVAAITADVTGSFPVAGAITVAADIAYRLLLEDIAVPAANLDAASFAAAAAAYPYAAGVYFGSSDSPTGVQAVDRVLAGFGAKLYAGRDGKLRVFALRTPGGSPVASYSPSNTISVVPASLPASLSPPTYRVRVAYQHNYTVQTSGLIGAATPARIQYVAQSDQYASAASTDVLSSYARPNDLPPVGGSLASQADAQAVANGLIALLGGRLRSYTVTVPVAAGLVREFGDIVRLTWPMDDLAAGRIGVIVGDNFKSEDATITLTVLT